MAFQRLAEEDKTPDMDNSQDRGVTPNSREQMSWAGCRSGGTPRTPQPELRQSEVGAGALESAH